MSKPASSHMGVGRGRFRKALRAVLLSRHATQDLEKLVRQELDWNCIYCGLSEQDEHLQLDHLWPESQGGCLVIGNVAPSCPTCNSNRRQVPWQEYMRTANSSRRRNPDFRVEPHIARIASYMEKHGQHTQPRLDSKLTSDELRLLENFDVLLAALSDGALATIGHQKQSAVTFHEPAALFAELVAVARRYQRAA